MQFRQLNVLDISDPSALLRCGFLDLFYVSVNLLRGILKYLSEKFEVSISGLNINLLDVSDRASKCNFVY